MIETRQSNLQVSKNVEKNSDRTFITLAKLDHVIWKINTYLSILKKEPVFKFVDHHNCRLGKWYYEGEGQSHYAKLASFQKIDDPHSVVHNGTKDILEALERGEYDIKAFTKAIKIMEAGSDGVFEYLDKVLVENDQVCRY